MVMVINHFYRWLYYRCYRHSLRGDRGMHWANASLYVVMLLLLNFSAFLVAAETLFRSTFGIPTNWPHWVIGTAFVIVVLLHHMFLRVGGRYKHIVSAFSNETPEQQIRGDRLFGWYVVLSMLAVVAAGVLAIVRMNPAS